ncbi:MAG: alpha/beta hydrolase [Bacteroidales bacterium]|nr:alpha/beta hydrolase [Bacteroidales bacterium]
MNVNRKTILFLTLIVLLTGTIHAGKPDIFSACFREYTFVDKIPAQAEKNILIISNRHFEPEDDYLYLRQVHITRKMFYFIASRIGDSAYITPYSSMESALEKLSPNKNFLVFVNGHGKSFRQIIDRGFQIGDRYNVNMVMFDWPTDYFALRKTARNARKVTKNFVQSMSDFHILQQTHFPDASVSLMFHSMGNHIARNMVKNDLEDIIPEQYFDNLILNAAAVPQRNHAEWVEQLNIQKRIYIVSNKGDRPLRGVKILRLTKPLGSEYDAHLAKNAEYISFNDIATIEHNIFLGRTEVEKNHPNVYNFYLTLFQGKELFTSDNEMFDKKEGELVYLIR